MRVKPDGRRASVSHVNDGDNSSNSSDLVHGSLDGQPAASGLTAPKQQQQLQDANNSPYPAQETTASAADAPENLSGPSAAATATTDGALHKGLSLDPATASAIAAAAADPLWSGSSRRTTRRAAAANDKPAGAIANASGAKKGSRQQGSSSKGAQKQQRGARRAAAAGFKRKAAADPDSENADDADHMSEDGSSDAAAGSDGEGSSGSDASSDDSGSDSDDGFGSSRRKQRRKSGCRRVARAAAAAGSNEGKREHGRSGGSHKPKSAEERKRLRREKNRVAARKCRQRKLELIGQMTHQVNQIQDKYDALQRQHDQCTAQLAAESALANALIAELATAGRIQITAAAAVDDQQQGLVREHSMVLPVMLYDNASGLGFESVGQLVERLRKGLQQQQGVGSGRVLVRDCGSRNRSKLSAAAATGGMPPPAPKPPAAATGSATAGSGGSGGSNSKEAAGAVALRKLSIPSVGSFGSSSSATRLTSPFAAVAATAAAAAPVEPETPTITDILMERKSEGLVAAAAPAAVVVGEPAAGKLVESVYRTIAPPTAAAAGSNKRQEAICGANKPAAAAGPQAPGICGSSSRAAATATRRQVVAGDSQPKVIRTGFAPEAGLVLPAAVADRLAAGAAAPAAAERKRAQAKLSRTLLESVLPHRETVAAAAAAAAARHSAAAATRPPGAAAGADPASAAASVDAHPAAALQCDIPMYEVEPPLLPAAATADRFAQDKGPVSTATADNLQAPAAAPAMPAPQVVARPNMWSAVGVTSAGTPSDIPAAAAAGGVVGGQGLVNTDFGADYGNRANGVTIGPSCWGGTAVDNRDDTAAAAAGGGGSVPGRRLKLKIGSFKGSSSNSSGRTPTAAAAAGTAEDATALYDTPTSQAAASAAPAWPNLITNNDAGNVSDVLDNAVVSASDTVGCGGNIRQSTRVRQKTPKAAAAAGKRPAAFSSGSSKKRPAAAAAAAPVVPPNQIHPAALPPLQLPPISTLHYGSPSNAAAAAAAAPGSSCHVSHSFLSAGKRRKVGSAAASESDCAAAAPKPHPHHQRINLEPRPTAVQMALPLLGCSASTGARICKNLTAATATSAAEGAGNTASLRSASFELPPLNHLLSLTMPDDIFGREAEIEQQQQQGVHDDTALRNDQTDQQQGGPDSSTSSSRAGGIMRRNWMHNNSGLKPRGRIQGPAAAAAATLPGGSSRANTGVLFPQIRSGPAAAAAGGNASGTVSLEDLLAAGSDYRESLTPPPAAAAASSSPATATQPSVIPPPLTRGGSLFRSFDVNAPLIGSSNALDMLHLLLGPPPPQQQQQDFTKLASAATTTPTSPFSPAAAVPAFSSSSGSLDVSGRSATPAEAAARAAKEAEAAAAAAAAAASGALPMLRFGSLALNGANSFDLYPPRLLSLALGNNTNTAAAASDPAAAAAVPASAPLTVPAGGLPVSLPSLLTNQLGSNANLAQLAGAAAHPGTAAATPAAADPARVDVVMTVANDNVTSLPAVASGIGGVDDLTKADSSCSSDLDLDHDHPVAAAAVAAADVDDDMEDEVTLVSPEGVAGVGGVVQQGKLGIVRLLPTVMV